MRLGSIVYQIRTNWCATLNRDEDAVVRCRIVQVETKNKPGEAKSIRPGAEAAEDDSGHRAHRMDDGHELFLTMLGRWTFKSREAAEAALERYAYEDFGYAMASAWEYWKALQAIQHKRHYGH